MPKPVRDQLAVVRGDGLRQGAGLHRQDAVQLLDQPRPKGAPEGHTVAVREVRLSAGAEFVVAICGEIMTMPGLPKVPAANSIDIDAQGKIVGLFLTSPRWGTLGSFPRFPTSVGNR